MRHLVLFLVYFAIVTPIGLLCRIGRTPLHGRPDPRAVTYWTFTGEQAPGGR